MKVTKEQFIGVTYEELLAENAKLRDDLEFERSENGWAREFLNRMAKHCGTKDCPSLVAYVTKLEAENAKLREEIEAAKHDLQVFSMGSVQLEAKNAKLRELVRELYEDQCDGCDRWKYRDRMRELGVDDG